MESSSTSTNKISNSLLEEEESGWTSYFEYFSQHNKNNTASSYEEEEDCSLVSDAGSGAPWKLLQQQQEKKIQSFSIPNPPRKLIFKKKTRTNEICSMDDSLEDTASSPVNSPKVRNLEESRQKKTEAHDQTNAASYLGKKDLAINERIKLQENKKDCSELQRRGLCLVPMSMLMNYIG